MTTLEDKIIKKELTPKGFIFYEYDEKTEDLVFRAFDYNVYDMQANDLIFRNVETPKGYHFDIYDSEWGKVVFLKNKTNPTDTSKEYLGYERVNGKWYKFYTGDDGLIHRCRVDNAVVSKEHIKCKEPVELKWEDCGEIIGHALGLLSEPHAIEYENRSVKAKQVFHTADQARASVALAMLSQQLARVNGEWKPDWNNGIVSKSFISQVGVGEFEIDWGYCTYHFLAFKGRDVAERFLEVNIDLIKQAAIFL